jgi:RND family efflux transporter MFP subunit
MRKLAKFVVPVVILGVAVLGFAYLRATRPQATPSPAQEKVWPVSAVAAEFIDIRPNISEFGTVVAGSVVDLRPLVAGRIVELGPNFYEGAVVRAGETLIKIDPFNYQIEVDDKKAALAEANARVKETTAELRTERRMLEIARSQVGLRERDLKRKQNLSARGSLSRKARDDARIAFNEAKQSVEIRQQIILRLGARAEQQKASVARAEAALKRAERDLDETVLIASKDGFLSGAVAAVGQRVSTNDRIARLIVADRMEVSFQLSQRDFGRLASDGGQGATSQLIGKKLQVSWRVGEERFAYDAVIERLGAEIDTASGGIGIYARIVAPDLASPLRPGAFVDVLVPGNDYRRVLRLPRSAVMDDGSIYVVKDGRLAAHPAKIISRVSGAVLVRADIPEGAQVITTRFPEIGPGVRVEIR